MHTIIFDRRDINLEYENLCLIVRQANTPPRTIPLSQISKIICLHSVKLSSALLGQLYERGIDFIHLNNRYSERSFAIISDQQKTVQRRCQQYQWQIHDSFCLTIAQKICAHRIRACFRSIGTQIPDWLKKSLTTAEVKIHHSQDLNELRGIEGATQRLMFEYWRSCLPKNLEFKSRQRRPPKDPVNALLSLTYTIALQEAIRQCRAAGLDSQLGFYHRSSFGRHSLACDLLEIVRPNCEKWVMHLFFSHQLDNRHFTTPSEANSACFLGKIGRQIYYQHLDEQQLIWRRQLRASAYWLIKMIDQQTLGASQ